VVRVGVSITCIGLSALLPLGICARELVMLLSQAVRVGRLCSWVCIRGVCAPQLPTMDRARRKVYIQLVCCIQNPTSPTRKHMANERHYSKRLAPGRVGAERNRRLLRAEGKDPEATSRPFRMVAIVPFRSRLCGNGGWEGGGRGVVADRTNMLCWWLVVGGAIGLKSSQPF
jgi:hypothetical protein